MSDVFYLRPIDPPIAPEDVRAMARHAGGCFDLHRVDWKHSFLAADGARMLCWYRAPDAESARLALRQLGSDMSGVWAGTVIRDESGGLTVSKAETAAEILLDEPLTTAELTRRTGAVRSRDSALVGGFVSTRGTKLVLLFAAPDPEAVSAVLDDADLTPDTVWSCIPITPFGDG